MKTQAEKSKIWRMWRNGTLLGKRVFVKRCRRIVVLIYPEIEGGIELDRPVQGFESWNVSDARLADDRGRSRSVTA